VFKMVFLDFALYIKNVNKYLKIKEEKKLHPNKGSNTRPRALESSALPIELLPIDLKSDQTYRLLKCYEN
jgi:hypothetical protein